MMVTYQFLGDAQRRLQPFDKSVEFHEEFLGGTEYVELLDAMEFFMSPMILHLQARAVEETIAYYDDLMMTYMMVFYAF